MEFLETHFILNLYKYAALYLDLHDALFSFLSNVTFGDLLRVSSTGFQVGSRYMDIFWILLIFFFTFNSKFIPAEQLLRSPDIWRLNTDDSSTSTSS